jgi:repressor LexA
MPSPKQEKLLQFISDYMEKNGIPPTQQEIAAGVKLKSRSVVNYHLDSLEKEGLIRRLPNTERGIRLVQPGRSLLNATTEVPLLGQVAAGHPIEVFSAQEMTSVPLGMINPRFQNYALRVRGDSMIDEHICDGDLVVIRSQVVAHNGQTVVALLDGSAATIKTIYFEGRAVRLQPANRQFKPLIVKPPRTLEIQGILVGVLRYPREAEDAAEGQLAVV